MLAFALRPPDPVPVPDPTSAAVPWLSFAEFRVLRADTLEQCLSDFPSGAGRVAAWPLLAFQVTFDLARLLDDGGLKTTRSQYARAWRLGSCVPDAVARIATRGLLVPLAVRWDDTPAVAFELCERLSPAREATRLKRMRVRPLRTYLLFVGDERFGAGPGGDGDGGGEGKRWLKVTAEGNALRRVELQKPGPKLPDQPAEAEPVPDPVAA